MKAAAAQKHWVRRQARRPQSARRSGRAIARISTVALSVLALVVLAVAAAGLAVTRGEDSRLAAKRHDVLQAALDELHVVFGDVERFDAGQLALIERRSGLADLRFDAEPSVDGSREIQSVHDGQGRITGWFSWTPDRAFIRAMERLWATAGVIGLVMALSALTAMRSARRLAAALTHNIATVHKLTTRDWLTGLANRPSMLKCLDETLATRSSRFVAFALIDIDGCRDFNDTLGWAGGDAMLCNIAERLTAALPTGATLGRFEDDEFAVIATSDDAEIADKLADGLTAALAKPIFLDRNWQISACIGIAQMPEDGTTGDQLHRHAALALRAAKRAGRGTVRRFAPQIHEQHSERRFLLRELEAAIDHNAIAVHYQPVVAAEGGAVVGVEALARWTHPTRGAIAPSTFIPLAEASGLMTKLGALVLKRALADAVRWPDLSISVNLSPVQMRDRGMLEFIRAVLAETGLAASRVVLEVTEGVLIDNPEETGAKLAALRALGVSTALDDFGTGYSSLSYLQKFPFDRLKIDRAFVASLGRIGNAGAIVQSVVTLGHALGMKVLAEGVETDEQRVLLRLAGCDEMQGFFFAKPGPAETIDEILAQPPRAKRTRNAS